MKVYFTMNKMVNTTRTNHVTTYSLAFSFFVATDQQTNINATESIAAAILLAVSKEVVLSSVDQDKMSVRPLIASSINSPPFFQI